MSKNNENLKGSMKYRSVSTPQDALEAIQDAVASLEYRASMTNPKVMKLNEVSKSWGENLKSIHSQYSYNTHEYPFRLINSYVRYDSTKQETVLCTSKTSWEIEREYKLYKDLITQCQKLYTTRHESNIEAIENNKRVRERVIEFMDAIGISSEKYTERKSGRKTTSVIVKRDWVGEIFGQIPINDGYDDAMSRCKHDLESLEKNYKAYCEYKHSLERKSEARKKFLEDYKFMTRLSIKYDTSIDNFNGVLSGMMNESMYFRLYHAWKTFEKYENDTDEIRWCVERLDTEQDKEFIDDILEACTIYDQRSDFEPLNDCDWLYISKKIPDELLLDYTYYLDINESEFNKRLQEM